MLSGKEPPDTETSRKARSASEFLKNRPLMVRLGIEQLASSPPARLRGRKLGLLCNQASTDRSFRHTRDLIRRVFPNSLTCLFSPQHGFFAEKQDNMIESDHDVDPVSGVPVFSLYGTERRPTREMFEHFDVLLVDLVDVGTRVYTFMYTLAYCLEEAARQGKEVLVLDRPNPLGGLRMEGNLLREECSSFVGLYPIPMRHGLTFGELARFMNQAYGIGAELEVITMAGWQRQMLHRETGLPFVFPSPNMPTPETALVYPGQVLWEGTNVSEGRGTALPFELCGAPFWEHERMITALRSIPLPGCILRPVVFEPTSNKWTGVPCRGFQLHITEPHEFLPYRTGLALLQATMRLHPAEFRHKEPPYEYEFERLPLDLILGDRDLRQALEWGVDLLELEESWQPGLREFAERRRPALLYP